MKKLLPILFLLSTYLCSAQNYQCLQSGVKHYFTNGNGYLRGIRIDSVRMVGDTVVYYPFHTPRGVYDGPPLVVLPPLDSTGGSWLGKRVLQLNDGTFIFDDNWHDSVIIKTQATLGDSWVFYQDTSSVYYTARVVSIDTMSVLGTLDTVKTILINAYNGTSLIATDPENGFQILLSKNHGFLQVFDLYTFPYHQPGAVYSQKQDYYLDNCVLSLYAPFYIPSPMHPDQTNSVFKLVNFINPTTKQLYNWNVGDVYEYSSCFGWYESASPSCNPPMQYSLDTVNGVVSTTINTQYTYTGLVSNLVIPSVYPINYATGINSGTLTCDTLLLLDVTFMPEEFKQPQLYYYLPDDTSYCMNSTLYAWIGNYLSGIHYQPPFESTLPSLMYKMNLGLVNSFQESADAGFMINSTTLIYYYRAGQSCSTYHPLPLSVPNIIKQNALTLFPNPATTQLTIQSSNTIEEINIINLLGQTVYSSHGSTSLTKMVDVSGWPGGVYFVKVSGTSATLSMAKFVKE